MQKKHNIISSIIILFVLALFLTSCASNAKKSLTKRAQLEYAISEAGVNVDKVTETGKGVEIQYEASRATSYDSQVIVEWATIMGAAAGMGYDPISIINTVNGAKYVTITTSAQNVNDFLASKKNETVFWQDVQITAAS